MAKDGADYANSPNSNKVILRTNLCNGRDN
jgi:hypothetical protein